LKAEKLTGGKSQKPETENMGTKNKNQFAYNAGKRCGGGSFDGMDW